MTLCLGEAGGGPLRTTSVTVKKKKKASWEDGSVGKVLDLQAWDYEFNSPELTFKKPEQPLSHTCWAEETGGSPGFNGQSVYTTWPALGQWETLSPKVRWAASAFCLYALTPVSKEETKGGWRDGPVVERAQCSSRKWSWRLTTSWNSSSKRSNAPLLH